MNEIKIATSLISTDYEMKWNDEIRRRCEINIKRFFK